MPCGPRRTTRCRGSWPGTGSWCSRTSSPPTGSTRQWRRPPSWHAMAATAERRPLPRNSGHALVEDVVVGSGEPFDPQTVLHIDTVFHTHKVWLYLHDVDEATGPLVYVP